MRLIDADAFAREMSDRIGEAIKWQVNAIADRNKEIEIRAEQAIATFCEASLTAKKMPTIEAEPIRHGHWIRGEKIYPDMLNDTTYGYWCSECHHADVHGDNVEVLYCWHCGAKMDSNDSNALNALEMNEVDDETK